MTNYTAQSQRSDADRLGYRRLKDGEQVFRNNEKEENQHGEDLP